MSNQPEQLLGQLHKLTAELETLAKSAVQAAEEGGSDMSDRFKGALAGLRDRVRETEQALEKDLAHRGKQVDTYVREHTWMSVGVAAAVAFLLGAAVGRRRD